MAAPTATQRAPLLGLSAQLQGQVRLLIGLGWLGLVALMLGLFIAGIPPRLEELRSEFQHQIGFDVFESTTGAILASPWSGGPAARAGVLERDSLVDADGVPLRGAAGLAQAQAPAMGALGSSVPVDVRTGEHPVRRNVVTLGGEQARPLARFGLSYAFVAAYVTAIDAAAAIVLTVLAGLIFWRTSNEWLPMLVSITMLALVAGAAPVIALYRSQPTWQPAIDFLFGLAFACVLVFFFVFPDGRFVPRWTRAAAIALVTWSLAAVFFPMLYPWRLSGWPGLLVMLGGLTVGVLAQTHRYRHIATTVQRQQTKWVLFGSALAAIGLGAQLGIEVVGDRESSLAVVRDQLVIRPLGQILIGLLPVSIGIALFRYRLWDIDVLINRTLVYGLLTTCIVGTYMLVVTALGAVLSVEGNPLVSLLAAGAVAVLFGPLRERLQRMVNRLLYGDRDDPYGVISRLAHRLGGTLTPDAVLPAVVTSVRDALRLRYAAIALERDEGLVIAAASGEPVADPWCLPLLHQGERVGELRVASRGPGEGWAATDRRLLDDLAGQAGAAVHAVRLTTDLQRLTGELQQARERLVLAREEERRRLRRDLHDELAPSLAALGLTAAAARDLVGSDAGTTAELLGELYTGIRSAVGDIRRIAYELRPPVLDELGLVAAIRERAARLDGRSTDGQPTLRVTVEAPDQPLLLPAAVEVATYRIVQEALMNVVRHARATRCVVCLSLDDGLHVEVLDDGIGPPDAAARVGIGLRSMRERAQELGGRCTIERRAEGGTRVCAYLPLRNAEA